MKIFSRLLIVAALLTVLGYGSYAFGRYVLSKRLFGKEVVPSSTSDLTIASRSAEINHSSTRKTNFRGDKPHVDVEVMPADEAGPGPEPPSLDNLQKDADARNYTPRRNSAASSYAATPGNNGIRIRSRYGEAVIGDDDGSYDSDSQPRHRRRRKRHTEDTATTTAATTATARTDAGPGADSTPDAVMTSPDVSTSSTDSSSGSDISVGGDTSPDTASGRTITSGSSSSSSDSPRHSSRKSQRRRSRDVSSGSSSTRRVESAHSGRTRRVESPIPRPEGESSSSGDSSPVPQPE